MRAKWLGQGLGVIVGATVALTAMQGSAAAARHKPSVHGSRGSSHSRHVSGGRAHLSFARSALQCVPFARENSGIELSGNAGTWWANAAGLYQRGARPEVGSILNFRSTGRMRMGHVAVVANVLSPRHIEIDHANWGAPGRISRNIDVVDVSPDNDWTQVRVAIDQDEDYGSVYPTYGFIYDRPDSGVMLANDTTAAPRPGTTPAATATVVADRTPAPAPEEVAEAADDDDATPAPRYTAHRRSSHGSRAHAVTTTASARSRTPTARTYRVSTNAAASAKPTAHKTTRRHF